MTIFDDFATFYTLGSYPKYSLQMGINLTAVLEYFDVQPKDLLDLACGEGTFALAMVKRGLRVTGADRSPQMLRIAEEKARRAAANIEFVRADFRSLPFESRFDLVTCWFDSLNYLLREEDLEKTFLGVARALKEGGLFIFDMNTIYGLAVFRFPQICRIQDDSPNLFIVHQHDYDHDTNIAEIRIVGFRREGEHWIRMEEIHHERGYPLSSIRAALQNTGLKELACWGSLLEMSPSKPDSARVYFILRKEAP
jgi:ubiquinone/menaquinone biosynthesis C-methylase UbiE